MGIQERVIRELVNRRTDLVVTIERSLSEGDKHGFVDGWLAEVKRFEARITELGGAFEPWEFPSAEVAAEKPEPPNPAPIYIPCDDIQILVSRCNDPQMPRDVQEAAGVVQEWLSSPTSTAGRE